MTPHALSSCEELLHEPGELYLRQVNPKHFEAPGVVGQDAFRPVIRDNGKLSGARSSKQTPQGACEEREAAQPGRTAGTWALSVQDVSEVEQEHQTGLRLVDDFECLAAEVRTLGHTYLDMRDYEQLSKNERQVVRDRLAVAANARGCLHPGSVRSA